MIWGFRERLRHFYFKFSKEIMLFLDNILHVLIAAFGSQVNIP